MPSRRLDDLPDPGAIAIAALSHFATEPKTLDRFFALTGLDPTSLRDAAASPSFIAGVLDFVLEDEKVLLAIAAAQETTPEAIMAARRRMDRKTIAEDDWPPRAHDDWA
ncbi:DUF3572 domain-containing protein [Acuticoccus mangrovi]|uniref:DUF3572 domain-containing protein n=1 Tax=Acuticoccus mangrovi TaxID=2796142 RepID=A0A934IJ47_9HYPH|nr:DUF3572 domain-containing protein [Acuticoccus mangrovi]MBJ3777649.1 DUF3572 domain-containing protein [Acuticoccus mangrovi]